MNRLLKYRSTEIKRKFNWNIVNRWKSEAIGYKFLG